MPVRPDIRRSGAAVATTQAHEGVVQPPGRFASPAIAHRWFESPRPTVLTIWRNRPAGEGGKRKGAALRIALLSPLFEPTPPQRYGGIERIVGVLCQELVRRGHDVTLFASGDSVTPARLIPCSPRSLRVLPDVQDQLALHMVLLTRVSELADEFAVIHNHLGHISYPFARYWPVPNLTTLHGRLDIPEVSQVFSHYRDINAVSISNYQREPVEQLDLS